MSENAIFVIFELGIKYRTIFIKTNYLKWLNIEISVRLTKLKAIWIILIFEKTISKHRSTKVEGYSIKTRGQSLDSNAENISSNSIWIFNLFRNMYIKNPEKSAHLLDLVWNWWSKFSKIFTKNAAHHDHFFRNLHVQKFN